MKPDYGVTLAAEDQKRISKEVLPLLKSLANADGANYTLASNLIMRSVVAENSPPLTLVDDLIVLLASALSVRYLPGYATLDTAHITQVRNTIETIRRYSEDLTQKRPLNFLMLAAPGAGKSHFSSA